MAPTINPPWLMTSPFQSGPTVCMLRAWLSSKRLMFNQGHHCLADWQSLKVGQNPLRRSAYKRLLHRGPLLRRSLASTHSPKLLVVGRNMMPWLIRHRNPANTTKTHFPCMTNMRATRKWRAFQSEISLKQQPVRQNRPSSCWTLKLVGSSICAKWEGALEKTHLIPAGQIKQDGHSPPNSATKLAKNAHVLNQPPPHCRDQPSFKN